MDKRRILRLFVIPTLAGVVASVVAYQFLRPTAVTAYNQDTVAVVLARQPIPARTKLDREMLVTKKIPRDYAFRGSLTSFDDAVGKITTAPLAEGEPVLKSVLAIEENKTGLAFHIPEGSRAFTISVGEVTGLAGRLEVGDHIDILALLPKGVSGSENEKAKMILENISILAIGRESTGGKNKGKGGYGSITVALKPEQAAVLSLAQEVGKIEVLLRSAADTSTGGDSISVTTDVFK